MTVFRARHCGPLRARERGMKRVGSGDVLLILLLTGLAVAAVFGPRAATTTGARARSAPLALASLGPALSDGMGLPRIMLWAWERPADLRFLDPRQVGVAFLAGTIEIGSARAGAALSTDDGVTLHPRLDPLAVPPDTALMSVVRIETSNDLWRRGGLSRASTPFPPAGALYSPAQRLRVEGMIVSMARLPGVRAVQVDYDASASERPFYRQLLEGVRRLLPPGMPLSVTALASWCLGDPWLNSLPASTVDEAVPMLFRMGPGAAEVADSLESGTPFSAAACRGSLGVSTDEAFSQAVLAGALASGPEKKQNRIYIFSKRPWTPAAVQRILSEVDRWDELVSESR